MLIWLVGIPIIARHRALAALRAGRAVADDAGRPAPAPSPPLPPFDGPRAAHSSLGPAWPRPSSSTRTAGATSSTSSSWRPWQRRVRGRVACGDGDRPGRGAARARRPAIDRCRPASRRCPGRLGHGRRRRHARRPGPRAGGGFRLAGTHAHARAVVEGCCASAECRAPAGSGATPRSRSAAVELEASELRRIERDLHDGAQQRLVMLSIDLGLAADAWTATRPRAHARRGGPGSGRQALAELRDLVRGIAPRSCSTVA